MTPIHICIITDNGYAIPTTVMLTSAKYHKNPQSHYVVHCLCNNVSTFAKQKLMSLDAEDFQIFIIDCNADKYSGLKMPPNITSSTMIKCDLPEILSDIKKVLVIDGDIIVKRDLLEIWQVELTDHLVAAVPDMVGIIDMNYSDLLGIDTYFNAGVMLLNLEQMRLENTGQKIIETKLNAPDTWEWGEQDPYNKVCDKRLIILPLRWNLTVLNFRYNHHELHEINQFFGTSYLNDTEMEDDAAIIHFNAYKPWKNRLMPFAPLWQKYHDMSPYGDTNLEHVEPYPVFLKKSILNVKLFGLIPFIRISENERRVDYSLFSFIKLCKIIKRVNRLKILLFGFIPIFSTSRQEINE